MQADPARVRVLLVEGYAGGPAVTELRAETVEWLVGLVVGEGGARGGRLSAEFAVGGINGVVRARVIAGDLDGLTDLVPSFVDTVVGARADAS